MEKIDKIGRNDGASGSAEAGQGLVWLAFTKRISLSC